MVGGAQQRQQPQQSQPTTTIAAATTSASVEEEALKRNTDCIYFLASPLTCKKGAECEYRHSDIARVNPRDCWYWLNGNCLNLKCGFRHPPLDGFLGHQAPTSGGFSVPPSQTAATPATHAPYTPGKQAVPCIFFQQGLCLKGDKCSFLHAPNSINNKVTQVAAGATVTEPPTIGKAFGGLEKCTQDQKVPQANVPKPVELPSKANPAIKMETAPPRIGAAIIRNVALPPSGLDEELLRYRPTNIPSGTNVNLSRSNHLPLSDDHNILNGKDVDEFSREHSPGFDVLVDDELRDSDYYHNEDQFGRTRAHEGRNLIPLDEYDGHRSADYNSMADVDREIYHDSHGYDTYKGLQGQYGWEQHRASSEKMIGGSAHMERRPYPRADSPDQIIESDLRHHLSKQRRGNGLRSVITNDYAANNHAKDRSSRREAHHIPPHESNLSSRLRGRIKIPGRSSSPRDGFDLRSEREMDWGRNGGRLSPGRSQISSHRGRLQERLRGKVQEDFKNEGRNFRGLHARRDMLNDENFDFAGPKRLSELKGRSSERNDQKMSNQQSLSLGKRKHSKFEGHQECEGDLSFEGPKPLSEILKRKREAEMIVPTNQKEGESQISGLKTTAAPEMQDVHSSVSKEAARVPLPSDKEESRSGIADIGRVKDGLISSGKNKPTNGQPSPQQNVSELENKEGRFGGEAMEDNEAEAYDQRDDDCDYEQVDGEDYNLDDTENAEHEEEFLDDEDDGDDFAKKIGVMFS